MPFVGKHAQHDQSTHGNWAREDYSAFVSSGGDLIANRPDGVVQVYFRGEPVGAIKFRLVEKQDSVEVSVSDILVREGHRRRGAATMMMNALRKAYPNWKIKSSTSFTREGAGFWRKVVGEDVASNPFVQPPKEIGKRSQVAELLKHASPIHPGTGTGQEAHGGSAQEKHAQHDQKDHGNWADGTVSEEENLREEYGGQHSPPEDGPPLHDLLAEGSWYPDDVYTSPIHYTFGDPQVIEETLAVIEEVRGNPDATVTVYRSAPPGTETINPGDWVALSRTYAEQHGAERDREYWDADVEWQYGEAKGKGSWVEYDQPRDWPVLQMEVRASEVRNGGNDLIEWGYWPNKNARQDRGSWKPGMAPRPRSEVTRDIDDTVARMRATERDSADYQAAHEEFLTLQNELEAAILKHYGPGPHPGTGTGQEAHGKWGEDWPRTGPMPQVFTGERFVPVDDAISGRTYTTAEKEAFRLWQSKDSWQHLREGAKRGLFDGSDVVVSQLLRTPQAERDQGWRDKLRAALSRNTARQIDSAIAAKVTTQPIVLFRGRGFDGSEAMLQVGDTWENPNYIAATGSEFSGKDYAFDRQEAYGAKGALLMEIHVPAGYHVGVPHRHPLPKPNDAFEEFILPRRSKFQVKEVKQTMWGTDPITRITVDLIDQFQVRKHYGPGIHPGTGTPQTVHGHTFYHGTSWDRAESINVSGFSAKKMGTGNGTMWGNGVYLASTLDQAEYWSKVRYSWTGQISDAPFVLEVEIPEDMNVFTYKVGFDEPLPQQFARPEGRQNPKYRETVDRDRDRFLASQATEETAEIFAETFKAFDAFHRDFSAPRSEVFGDTLIGVLQARGYHALEIVADSDPESIMFIRTGGHQLVVFDNDMISRLKVKRVQMSKRRGWFLLAGPDSTSIHYSPAGTPIPAAVLERIA